MEPSPFPRFVMPSPRFSQAFCLCCRLSTRTEAKCFSTPQLGRETLILSLRYPLTQRLRAHTYSPAKANNLQPFMIYQLVHLCSPQSQHFTHAMRNEL